MKTTITIIGLSAILTCLSLSAQEPPRATAAAVAARFKQLDRNGDGKLTADEAGQFPWFKRSDKNNDGIVTLEEVQAEFGQPGGAERGHSTFSGGDDVVG